MNRNIRPFELQSDLDAAADLIESAFAGDLARWGTNFRKEIENAKSMVPIVRLLRRVSKKFRHIFDGFVCEEDGKLISMVNVMTRGIDQSRWLIGNVATHPDYQRRGLARQLVSKAIDHAKEYGAQVCTLEVNAAAEPAYKLYRSLGFVHYDTTTALKLEAIADDVKPPDLQTFKGMGYSLRSMNLGEWQARYDLALRSTPQEVQDFLPVSRDDFRIMPIEYILAPLAARLQKQARLRWAVEKNSELAAYLTLSARKDTGNPHEITLRMDPAHEEALVEPLLCLALAELRRFPANPVRMALRSNQNHAILAAKAIGFVELDVEHLLGLKIN